MVNLKRLFGSFRRGFRDDGGVSAPTSGAVRWIVAGLGNPGEAYAHSRHNAGFRVLDRVAKMKGVEFGRRKFRGLVTETALGGEPALLVKPQTYYNLSGECVGPTLGYFKLPPSRLIVVHDDLDLEMGRLRLKQGGGDAGNRGVRSIAQALGNAEFARVRVGIGRPPPGEDSKDYVLRAMNAEELKSFDEALDRAAQAVEAVVAEGLERAMGRFNQRA